MRKRKEIFRKKLNICCLKEFHIFGIYSCLQYNRIVICLFVFMYLILSYFDRIGFHGIKIQENTPVLNYTLPEQFPKQNATQLSQR